MRKYIKLIRKVFSWTWTSSFPFQFNFQVLLFIGLLSGKDSICSGSILSQKYVLSAAHCFQNFEYADIIAGILNFELDDAEYEVTIVSWVQLSRSTAICIGDVKLSHAKFDLLKLSISSAGTVRGEDTRAV